MNEVTAAIIHEDGNAEIAMVDPDLESLQAIVGGYIEQISPLDAEYGAWHAYCDEEGQMKGRKVNAPANIVAVECGWNPGGDILVGTVVFLGTADGKEADCPEPVLGEVMRLYRDRGSVQLDDEETPPRRWGEPCQDCRYLAIDAADLREHRALNH